VERLGASEPLHRSLSSSKRLMRILRPIVEPTTYLIAIGLADLFHRRGMRAKSVGDNLSGGSFSISRYFTEILDPSLNCSDVEDMVRVWNGPFCLKGTMSAADAKKAVDLAATALFFPIMAGGNWTAPAAPSINWPRSWMRSATRST
jgi:isopentenyl diphosphate isomerase/L-lactate dehydrogenase-like FMN-dependent dehydrogenase